MEQPNYYAIIPAEVRYDKRLRDKAKLLYGEIVALSNKTGICYAQNKYFADLYEVSTTTISTLIKELVDAGYITTEIIYKEGTKEILNRYLKIFKYPTQIILNTPPPANTCESNSEGTKKSANNTSNNNIYMGTEEEKLKYNFEILWSEYPRKDGKADAFRHYKVWLNGKQTPLGRRKLTNDEMLEAIQNYKQQIADRHTEPKYIKQGSTFFNLGILDYLPKEKEDG